MPIQVSALRLPMFLIALGVPLPSLTAQQQDVVPKGEVTKYTFDRSKIFPGTVRDYWVYVPKQYDPAKPACVHVNQDGIQFNAPAVFDRLIHKKEMPVVIGVFIMHGRVKATSEKALDRFNRSYEYDSLGDEYVRFLLEELLPDVEKKKTTDGRAIKLSKNGNDRSIGGSSSGAVCAFTAAWERPDAFSRVFSAIGTFVGLRGANVYPTLIRKYEPKPIRVFLQDGSKDQNIYGGDWWMANQEMERSLTFAGYDVKHSWDDGGHSNVEGTKVFPEAMKWLWKDWPSPVKAGAGSIQMKEILLPGEGWKVVSEGVKSVKGGPKRLGKGTTYIRGLAANAKGEIYFDDTFWKEDFSEKQSEVCRIGLDGKTSVFCPTPFPGLALAFGPDGRLYSAAEGGFVAYDSRGKTDALLEFERFEFSFAAPIVASHDGKIYLANHRSTGKHPGISLINIGERKIKSVDDFFHPGGIAFSPDQSLLYASDFSNPVVYSFQIRGDGSLAHKQKFFSLQPPEGGIQVRGMCVDRDGRLYVATFREIQICDQAGRVLCIVPIPCKFSTSNLCFGGPNFDILYANCSDKIYARKLKVRGANAFEAPIKPAPPRL